MNHIKTKYKIQKKKNSKHFESPNFDIKNEFIIEKKKWNLTLKIIIS